MTNASHRSIVVLISGTGSNLKAIYHYLKQHQLSATISAVISNRPDAMGLTWAKENGIKTIALDHTLYDSRLEFDKDLIEEIDKQQPDLVVLAGYMRILSSEFVQHYHGKLLNVHPSLLPNYRGLNTHKRVLESGETYHGTSVHFVSEDLDGGPVIAQAKLVVERHDTEQTLMERIQKLEHKLFPLVISLFIGGRITQHHSNVLLDNKPLKTPLLFDELSIPSTLV